MLGRPHDSEAASRSSESEIDGGRTADNAWQSARARLNSYMFHRVVVKCLEKDLLAAGVYTAIH
jgi:hypothetical protein